MYSTARALRILFLTWLLVAPAIGAQGAQPDEYSFDLSFPAPSLTEDSDGFVTVEVDGLGAVAGVAGRPDIPTRSVLVAIPPGASPRLTFERGASIFRGGIVPKPVPRAVREYTREDREAFADPQRSEERRLQLLSRPPRKVFEKDSEAYRSKQPYPAEIAWLGEIGVLRDQRYVEVHVAPIRYHASRGGLEIHSDLRLTVHFDGAQPATTSPRIDPRFEPIYRDAFENYAQGKSFRLSGNREPVSRAASSVSSSRAVGPIYKIKVRKDGVVRLDHSLLSAAGFTAHDISLWRLNSRGVQIPLQIKDDGAVPDTLEAGEWVQFFGERLDHEPDFELNTDLPDRDDDLYQAADFSDENVYFLTVEAAPQAAMTTRDATPPLGTVESYFVETLHYEVDDFLRPLGGGDPWYSWPPVIGSTVESDRVVPLSLDGLFDTTAPLQVRVRLRGLSPIDYSTDQQLDPDHLTRIELRNDLSQLVATDSESWDGRIIFDHDFSWTFGGGASISTSMDVSIVAEPLGVSGLSNSIAMDWIEIDYRRGFVAAGGELIFQWPDGDAEFVVQGIAGEIEVWEITEPAGGGPTQAVQLTGWVPGAGDVRFRIDNDLSLTDGTPRRFVVVGTGGSSLLAAGPDFAADTVSDLRVNATQADMVVIAHPDVLDQGPASGLTQLLAHRATAAGGGLTSKVVLLEDVQDEFNHGLEGPEGIQEFLRWINSDLPGEGWADPKPAFVMLLGDGSYDYKAGTAFGNFIPTQMMFQDFVELSYYTSDTLLGAFAGGDQIPDVMIGRIPARTVAEANLMLQKIVDYEGSAPGPWKSRALTVSDRGKYALEFTESLAFESINDGGLALLSQGFTGTHLRYYPDYYVNYCPANNGCPSQDRVDAGSDMNDDIDFELNDPLGGAAIVQYIGHGNFETWSNDAIWDERATPPDGFQVQSGTEDLTNSGRLPFLLAHNCLTGGFHFTWRDPLKVDDSVAEEWLREPSAGAVGAFAPSGLSFNFFSEVVIDEVWSDFFGPTKERVVGIPAMNTAIRLCGQGSGSIQACQFYVLLGDPAMRIALPSVEPATDPDAVGGHYRVDLTWTESLTPSTTYDIYRQCIEGFSNCSISYVPVASGISGSSWSDLSAINAYTYRYYVVAVQPPDGFESPWSNFNSDCDTVTPVDCVEATALNPNPPDIPSGVAVSDPGDGSLKVAWTPSVEPDFDFNTVHYGTAPGVYTFTRFAGKDARVVLNDLVEGQMYYIVVTATNTSTLTSSPSTEVSDFPVFAPGLHPPAYIGDLTVRAQGSDTVLEWPEVVADAYGKPMTVASYEIYRGTNFSPGSLVAIDSCLSPCTSYVDAGAMAAPDAYYYRVAALDGGGLVGGLGAEPPSPVLTLAVGPSLTPGNVLLEWDPITTTIGGTVAQIQGYRVYESATPFSREDILNGIVTATTTVSGTSADLPPPAGDGYYAVLAEDILGQLSPF